MHPTQGVGAQAVATFSWVASCAHSLWLTLLVFTEKQCFCRFENPHKHCGLPHKHLQSVVFLNYFYSSSNEGKNLLLNNVYFISCNSLEMPAYPSRIVLVLLLTAPNTVGFPVVPPILNHLEFNRHFIHSVLNKENNIILISSFTFYRLSI